MRTKRTVETCEVMHGEKEKLYKRLEESRKSDQQVVMNTLALLRDDIKGLQKRFDKHLELNGYIRRGGKE